MSDAVSTISVQDTRPVVGRFAPSPTGRMHAGNIYASLLAWLIAKSQNGKMVLRIEDLDRDRSRVEFIDRVQADYEMLGLTWDDGPYYQNDREEAYQHAYELLAQRCGVYPCFCSRADLKAAASAPHLGDKNVYPGTCRNLTPEQQLEKGKEKHPSFRLIVPDKTYAFHDAIQGDFSQNLALQCGDFLIRRADGMFAYQLAVTVDDAAQGVTSVTRGYDLITSSPQQMFLLEQLGHAAPNYAHVPLFVNEQGRRLSKRDKDASLQEMLATYRSSAALLGHIAFIGKVIDADEPATPEELLSSFGLERFAKRVREEIGILQPIVWR